ncbi:MAG: aldehyde dehydrogenase (NADP(+)) [Lewinellaceae bacterium]|nr:aldehyde dehydrogenase (NADP(+)) [Saprospiraceae bacterium]MCB9339339.1 aldehyde dehydrogenase (NADP(+)) [Lewinellaceae bacterium]
MAAIKNILGFKASAKSKNILQGITAAENRTTFYPATRSEINEAMTLAAGAFQTYRHFTGQQKAMFLRAIAEEIEFLGEKLVQTAMLESGLPEGRITGERGRTCGQLRLFADYLVEGSWVEAVIDQGNPERQPLPKPDIRRMLVPTGPAVVFTASNFPLAFSTAGGDTASALAAGCPVVVKAHEAHPATNELVALAIQKAAKRTGMPEGVFSSLNGDYKLGQALVKHPLTASVAFTGSHRGGRALFDLAGKRPNPIPVFAEMGSVNPIFILPNVLETQSEQVAEQIAASVTLGAGQFCTNPGLVFVPEEWAEDFAQQLLAALSQVQPQCMLNQRIFESYLGSLQQVKEQHQVAILYEGEMQGAPFIRPSVGLAKAAVFLKNPHLQEEVFGPFTLLVSYAAANSLEQIANALQGQLTASVFAEKHELPHYQNLLNALQNLSGRLILNAVPTGVEVCHAMQHGGPYPATTDSRFTSVGTAAIRRFVRPVAWQNFPGALLPEALQDGNPLGIWRMVDGAFLK